MSRTFWLILVLAAVLLSASAKAQSTRTFVSGTGTDSGTCGRPAPCRTFAYAIGQTNSGGEIVVLDSAGYGPVTIAKAVSISNPSGVEAKITAPSGQPAIVVNTFGQTTTVALRGLTLEGQGVATDGILDQGTGRIEIVDCVIRNFTHDGINMTLGQFGGTNPNTIFISNTTVSDNGANGIEIAPNNPFLARGAIDHVIANANGQSGILINGANTGTGAFVDFAVSGATADSNGGDGFTINGVGDVKVEMKNSTSSNNGGNGLTVSNAKVGISATSLVVNTNSGFSNGNSGTLTSFGDNLVENNRLPNVGSLTPHVRNPC